MYIYTCCLQVEFMSVMDDRSRSNTSLTAMAGVFNTLMMPRTAAGNRGTAGQWPSQRKVVGLTTQGPPSSLFSGAAPDLQSALMSVVNVTFVNFTGSYSALEACGKCKNGEGGATTSVAGLKFLQPGFPFLAYWTWAHQVWLSRAQSGARHPVYVQFTPNNICGHSMKDIHDRVAPHHLHHPAACVHPSQHRASTVRSSKAMRALYMAGCCCLLQGIYLDTDGSLINSKTLPASLLPEGIASGAGATLHSAVDNGMFSPSECVYVLNATATNNAAWCDRSLTFRRARVSCASRRPPHPRPLLGACFPLLSAPLTPSAQ